MSKTEQTLKAPPSSAEGRAVARAPHESTAHASENKLHAAAAKLLHSSPPSTDRACAAAF